MTETSQASIDFSHLVQSRIDLPSAPVVIQRLHSLIASDRTGSHEIAEVVETDQAFTARILKLVNSPFYGFARQITSVGEAVTMLGINAVHQLLLTTSVLNTLGSGSAVFDGTRFWEHSFGVGVVAKHLLHRENDEVQAEALSCGILHDIGRLLLLRADEKRFASFYGSDGTAFDVQTERQFFGIDHQKLGALLAEKWNFPDNVTAAIRFHHSPAEAPSAGRMVATINVADLLCHAMQIGDSGNHFVTEFSPEIFASLSLNPDVIESALHGALDDIRDVGRFLTAVA